jgi:hypothetical protein
VKEHKWDYEDILCWAKNFHHTLFHISCSWAHRIVSKKMEQRSHFVSIWKFAMGWHLDAFIGSSLPENVGILHQSGEMRIPSKKFWRSDYFLLLTKLFIKCSKCKWEFFYSILPPAL